MVTVFSHENSSEKALRMSDDTPAEFGEKGVIDALDISELETTFIFWEGHSRPRYPRHLVVTILVVPPESSEGRLYPFVEGDRKFKASHRIGGDGGEYTTQHGHFSRS